MLILKLLSWYKRFFIMTFLVSCAAMSYGKSSSNQYIDFQSGSLLGLGHASYGLEFSSKHHLLTGIGYVPKLSNHNEMMLFSVRYRYDFDTTWEIKDMKLKPFSIGAGFLISEHDDLFLELPSQYPDGYYAPSALRIVFNYQASLQVNPLVDMYFDLSILDVGLVSYIREPEFFYDNYDYLGLEGITNWGFGVRYAF